MTETVSFRLFVLSLAAVLCATTAVPQIVVPDPDDPAPFVREDQVEEEEDDEERRRRTETPIPAEPEKEELVIPVEATRPTTTLIVERIREEAGVCDNVPGPYMLDCLAQRFERVARSLPETGDYAVAREAVETVSKELNALVRENRPGLLQRERLTLVVPDGSETGERTQLRAVTEDSADALRAEAVRVIEEQTTILLRSAQDNPATASHYTRIAQAVDSTKLLLRS